MQKKSNSDKIKNIIRFVLSAVISYPIVKNLELSTFYSILFFIGIYIAISLIIEAVWRIAENSKK